MSTNATSADPGGSLSVTTDVLTETFIPAEPPAGRRQTQLRRQLLSADIIAGSLKTKAMGNMAKIMPDTANAQLHRGMAEPGSAEP